jgi:hypothetical protein
MRLVKSCGYFDRFRSDAGVFDLENEIAYLGSLAKNFGYKSYLCVHVNKGGIWHWLYFASHIEHPVHDIQI